MSGIALIWICAPADAPQRRGSGLRIAVGAAIGVIVAAWIVALRQPMAAR